MESSQTENHTIVTTRILNAPIKIVYKAWADPVHLAAWWGPKGFTNTFHEFDLKPGGKWIFTMHGPDKGNYQNECEFTKIIPQQFISWKRHSHPLFNIEISFEKISDVETKVIFKMVFDDPVLYNKVISFIPDKNEENFDRLEEELKKMTTD
ncbi:SRPBCC family protein [Ferruginibacter sp. SUN002]|uniref:SRPBCC family protein n=1 Tax=Ferruginibacter sp. SUN002 TaxID=2937789 RepID=UPI003D364B08